SEAGSSFDYCRPGDLVRSMHAQMLVLWIMAAPAAAPDERHFRDHVAPILERHCIHSPRRARTKRGLLLTPAKGMLTGGKAGPAVVPGKPDDSYLLEMISGKKPKMPRGADPLSPAQIGHLKKWIEDGATWPKDLVLRDRSDQSGGWWSLRPVVKPGVPAVKEPAWVRSPLDVFILHRLEEKGIAPSGPADRRTLIRRLTFDLHGLPPAPEEIEAFVKDPAPNAYEKLVDRLLASARYGERWGRHWLDVARFGESQGFERDKIRDHSWPYRDYVISSLNADKSYWRFIKEQIAGDQIEPVTGDG